MSILGTRVVRTEDPLFLTRGAVYTDDLADERLTGGAARHLRALAGGPRAGSPRSTPPPPARPRASSPSSPPTTSGAARAAAGSPLVTRGHGAPWLARDVVRFVGRAGRRGAHRGALPGRGRRGAGRRSTYDPLPAVVDHRRGAARDEVAAVPGRRDQRRGAATASPTGGLLRRLRGRGLPADRQPARRRRAAGDAGRRRGLGRRRPGDPLVLQPGRAAGQGRRCAGMAGARRPGSCT